MMHLIFVALVAMTPFASLADESRPIQATGCGPFHPVLGANAAHPLALVVRGGNNGTKEVVTTTPAIPKKSKTTGGATATPAIPKKSSTAEVPAGFFRTSTALRLLGCSMLCFGIPMLVAPAWTHSMLFVPSLDDMARAYERLTAVREIILALSCLVVADKASEHVQRTVMVLIAAMASLQIHLFFVASPSLLQEHLRPVILIFQGFYLLYLPFSAFLSLKQTKLSNDGGLTK